MPRPSALQHWNVFGASVRGAAHMRDGRSNQDALHTWSLPDTGHAIVAVSDGHGGAPHPRSAVGSQFAVESALATLSSFVKTNEPPSPSQQKALVVELGTRWQEAVAAHVHTMPLTPQERELVSQHGAASADHDTIAYGATVLAAAATRDWLLLLQLGDGDMLAVTGNGVTRRPLPADARLVGGRTLSLCQPEAWHEARTTVLSNRDLPELLLIATDGYANSFETDDDFLAIGRDYLELLHADADDVRTRLPQILNDASTRGSTDDITLGVMHRLG